MYRKRKRDTTTSRSATSNGHATSSISEVAVQPREVTANVEQMLEVVTKSIPPCCLVCDTAIYRNSVLFHCECLVVYCQSCATLQVAAQRDTYTRGLQCPYCRQPSDNIRSIAICKSVESGLIERAFQHYKIRTSRNDDGVCKALYQFMNDDYRGTISPEEVHQADNRSEISPALRLELARLECLRESEGSQPPLRGHQANTLPLGPLKHLTFTRNIVLEHALEIQRQTRLLWATFLGTSYDAAVAYLTNEAEMIDYRQVSEAQEVEADDVENEAEEADESDEEYVEDLAEDQKNSVGRDGRSRRSSNGALFSYYPGGASQLDKANSNEPSTLGSHIVRCSIDGSERGSVADQSSWNDTVSMNDEDNNNQGANLRIGSRVKMKSGSFAGLTCAVVGFPSSGDTVRVEYTDSHGHPRKTTVLRKNVTPYDEQSSPVNGSAAVSVGDSKTSTRSDTVSTKSGVGTPLYEDKPNGKLFCICQTPYKGPYVRCMSGKGVCNGYVHPACFVELDGKSADDLAAIEQAGFMCSSCVEVLSLTESLPATKNQRNDGPRNLTPMVATSSASSSSSSSSSTACLSGAVPSQSSQFAIPSMNDHHSALHPHYQRIPQAQFDPMLAEVHHQQYQMHQPAFGNGTAMVHDVGGNGNMLYGTYPSYYNVSPLPQLRFDPYAHPVSAGYVSSVLRNSLQSLSPSQSHLHNGAPPLVEGLVNGAQLTVPASMAGIPRNNHSMALASEAGDASFFKGSSDPSSPNMHSAQGSYSTNMMMHGIPIGSNSAAVLGQAMPGPGLSPQYLNGNIQSSPITYMGPDRRFDPIYPPNYNAEAIDPRSQFVQKQPKKITSCDVQVIRWMISTANVFPVLVNRPINNREVTITIKL
jgi:hypothetical protein